jgi:hypothetical protein
VKNGAPVEVLLVKQRQAGPRAMRRGAFVRSAVGVIATGLQGGGEARSGKFPVTPFLRPISANSNGGVASHSTPRTTILHNDNAGRKRYLYQLTNDVRSSVQSRLLRGLRCKKRSNEKKNDLATDSRVLRQTKPSTSGLAGIGRYIAVSRPRWPSFQAELTTFQQRRHPRPDHC